MASPFGFRPSRHLNGSNCFSTMTFLTSALTDLWQGQLVILASGLVQEATSTTVTPILGVIKAAYSGTKNRPLTHQLPGGRNSILSGASALAPPFRRLPTRTLGPRSGAEMSSLFFLLAIIAMFLIIFWATKNDRNRPGEKTTGLLRLKEFGGDKDRKKRFLSGSAGGPS